MSELTDKQEHFCKAYVGEAKFNASEAYRIAYNSIKMKPTTINRKAKEVMDNGKVKARIAELQAEHAERHNVTVDSLTAELDELIRLAKETGNISPAVTAVMGKAKIHGLEKKVVDLNADVNGQINFVISPPDENS